VTAGAGESESESSRRQFVETSRRMALASECLPATGSTDPGAVLIELLGFADAVARSQPARPFAPLEFPVLARLVEDRRASGGAP
jgi:hypothetical protein